LYRDAKPGDVVKPDVLKFARADENTAAYARFHSAVGDDVPEQTLRERFTDWLISHDRFAAMFAVRIWSRLFLDTKGRRAIGCEPAADGLSMADAESAGMTDMLCNGGCGRAGASPPLVWESDRLDEPLRGLAPLLARLARETGFRARELQRVMMRTAAYQRVAVIRTLGDEATPLAAPSLRRMTAEQLWDSLVRIGGGSAADFQTTRELPQALPFTHALRLIGRGARAWGDDDVPSVSFGLTRWMMNGPVSNRAAHAAGRSARDADDVFLAILSRRTSEAERALCDKHLAEHPGDLASIAAALVCTGEFLFIQ
jgi:hypothetical protein